MVLRADTSIEALKSRGAVLMGNRHHAFAFREDKLPRGWMPGKSEKFRREPIDYVNAWSKVFGLPPDALSYIPGTDRVYGLALGPRGFILEESPTFPLHDEGVFLIDAAEGVTFLVDTQHRIVGNHDTWLRFTLNPMEVSVLAVAVPPLPETADQE